jgi:tetratricopeptide (TPR) repeat protein
MDIIDFGEQFTKYDLGPEAFILFAEELCSQRLWAKAVQVCRQGLTFFPQHFRARVLLGWALRELGEREQAEKVLMEAAEEIQKNALLFKLLAEIAEEAGDHDRAMTLMNMVQGLYPGAFDQTHRLSVAPTPAFEVESATASPVGFLASMLASCEAKPAGIAETTRLFSDEERRRLVEIIESRKP